MSTNIEDLTIKVFMPAPKPEILWWPDENENKAYLCIKGVDNNFAVIHSVEHSDFVSAHDTACRTARILNAFPQMLEALRACQDDYRDLLRVAFTNEEADEIDAMLQVVDAAIARAEP